MRVAYFRIMLYLCKDFSLVGSGPVNRLSISEKWVDIHLFKVQI